MITIHDSCTTEIESITFKFVQELNLERDATGQIKQFMPQDDTGK